MPARLVYVAIWLASFWLSTASADRPRARILLVVGNAEDLSGLANAASTGVSQVLSRSIVGVRALDAQWCWPTDPGCAARLAAPLRATHIVLVRVLWARGGCVPIRDAAGATSGPRLPVVGHRMLRHPSLEVDIVSLPSGAVSHLGPRDLPFGDRGAAHAAAADLVSRL